ncbi:sensor histidine kinase [Nocardioides sp. L-11A]|uniref:sensor histidine kinase n=1 Tax=Nocardioides sp. L-11A TaxID=3043848 RepID=UPI00249A6E61|nr:sensor histidine kinase [Nocardioides sp. L-11A]
MSLAPDRHPRCWWVLAWLIACTAWLLSAGAVLALISTGVTPPGVADWIMDVVTSAVYGGVVLMMLPRARHPVVWILALTALGCGASGLAAGYVALDGWPGQDLAIYLPFWAWVPGVYATVSVVPLLVVPGARHRWPAVALATVAIGAATVPSLTVVVPGLPPNPFGIDVEWWQSLMAALGLWPDRTVAALGACVWVWLLVRVRRTPAEERRGLTWLLAGHGAMVIALVAFLLPLSTDLMGAAVEVSGTLLLLAQLFLPAALLVLVLGQQLWGVDARVNRGVVWLMMTVVIALAYLALIGLAAQVLPDQSDVALALAVGLVGLGATPLRRLVQRRVDRLVYGTGPDPARLLSRADSEGGYDIDSLAAGLCRSLRLADVHILVSREGEPASASGAVGGDDVVLTLTSRGTDVGVLIARPRPGERLDRRTIAMLTEVAGLVGMTIDLMQSVQALSAARRRMTGIRHEERRMLRRDLHDGLGPALAGIRLGLIAARGMRDPRASEEMLDALERELTQQGEEVRRLSRSLVPLALDDGDLASALATLAERFTADGLVVRAAVADDVMLEASVQVAVYQMASEALLNVRRHAQATRCDVVLRQRADGHVVFSVSDDGIGMAEDRVDGIGLRSMRERAQELGGALRVSSGSAAGTGSRIELRLPPSATEAGSGPGSAEDLGLPARESPSRAGQQ